MRWHITEYINEYTRYKTRFLLFPKYIKGEWRWLEVATYKQNYMKYSCDGESSWEWKSVEWV